MTNRIARYEPDEEKDYDAKHVEDKILLAGQMVMGKLRAERSRIAADARKPAQ